MSVKLVVANTDEHWLRTLRQIHNLREVNFWAPSAKSFRALKKGEFFLFKQKAPYNRIVGGGIFTYATRLPCSLAWEAFGRGNGAQSLQEMRQRILAYRSRASNDRSDFEIGCRILVQPFFFDDVDCIPVPSNWKPNIVTLKTYDTNDAEGRKLWDSVVDRMRRQPHTIPEKNAVRFGKPTLVQPRLGQGAFRIMVTDNYERRCAITRERTLPVLEAAHIRPYSDGGLHQTKNGLLLRSDIHKLFDAGYVTVTRDLRFEVSKYIKEEFNNGRHYYDLHGVQIHTPSEVLDRPDPALLEWHNEQCYKG